MAVCGWTVLVVLAACCLPGDASHFRGAIIMFRTLNDVTEVDAKNDGVKIEVIYRIGWRRSYSIGTYCDATTIANGTMLLSEGRASLRCVTGCSGNLADMKFYCTDFSETEDWTYGERTTPATIPYQGNGIVQASYANSAWIRLVSGGGRWEVRLSVNLTKIITERGGNKSPISKMAPVLRLQHGCNHTIDIPVEDADGDNIRCRWAARAKGECGGVCQTFPGSQLDERACKINYPANGRVGYYAVAIQIEDFVDRVDTVAFSSVPLQFLVFVYTSTSSCYSKPEFISPPTRTDDSCIGVPPNGTFSEMLLAKAGGPGLSIVDIGTQSPPGMQKSSLAPYGDTQWHVNMTWTPSQQQYGTNLFCYVAKDSTQRTSDQSCVVILGGVTPPSTIPGTMSPTGKIHPQHSDWQVQFDRDIFRPKRSAFIRFFDTSGREVYQVDTGTSPSVSFPDPQVSDIMTFQTDFRFTEKAHYYVTLDDGVAIGKEYCGPESIKEMDTQFWQLL